jgi:hypothetical protein
MLLKIKCSIKGGNKISELEFLQKKLACGQVSVCRSEEYAPAYIKRQNKQVQMQNSKAISANYVSF